MQLRQWPAVVGLVGVGGGDTSGAFAAAAFDGLQGFGDEVSRGIGDGHFFQQIQDRFNGLQAFAHGGWRGAEGVAAVAVSVPVGRSCGVQKHVNSPTIIVAQFEHVSLNK
jgi:hypothetical protein